MALRVFLLLTVLWSGPVEAGPNRVLSLDGEGDFVELPSGIFADLRAATVEAWVRWEQLSNYGQVFGFGSGWHAMGVNTWENASILQFFIYDKDRALHLVSTARYFEYKTGLSFIRTVGSERWAGDLLTGQWRHIAAVSGPGGMKLYLDGVLVAERDYEGSFAAVGNAARNLIGASHWESNGPFNGQIDEVRVWDRARSQAEIRAGMRAPLRGREPGLVGLWNFDGACAEDQSPSGYHGTLVGDAHCAPAAWPAGGAEERPAVVYGTVRDQEGRALSNARVRVERAGVLQAHTWSDSAGYYSLTLAPCAGCDLAADSDSLGAWQLGIDWPAGTRDRRDIVLHPAPQLVGQVTTWDFDDLQSFIAVEAIHRGFPDAAVKTHTDMDGYFRIGNLRPGRYQVRCQVPGGPVYFEREIEIRSGLPEQWVHLKIMPFNKGAWRTFSIIDGLADNDVQALYRDADGILWLGTAGGLSRFDGSAFVNYTTADGLAHDDVRAVWGDGEAIWLGTAGGLSRFDGSAFVNYTTADGLADDDVRAVWGDGEAIWLGTAGGLSRFAYADAPCADADVPCDGSAFVNYTTADGLPPDAVVQDVWGEDDGTIWFGTFTGPQYGGGLYRLDASGLTVFEGPLSYRHSNLSVSAINRGVDGALWVGSSAGLGYFDRARQELMLPDELMLSPSIEALGIEPFGIGLSICPAADGGVWVGGRGLWYSDGGQLYPHRISPEYTQAILQDQDGVVWLGTDNGLVRYDRGSLVEYSPKDRLQVGPIRSLHHDSRGATWIVGTRHGLARFDGERFEHYRAEIHLFTSGDDFHYAEAADGSFWLGYSPRSLTKVRIDGSEGRTRSIGGLSGRVAGLHVDRADRLWFGDERGLGRYGDAGHTRFDDSPKPLLALYGDADDTLWLGGEQGLWRYDGAGCADAAEDCGSFTHYGDASGGPAVPIHLIGGAPDGTLWMAADDGVWSFDGAAFARLGPEQGLPADQIHDLYHDGEILWLATRNYGLLGYDGTAWTSLDVRDGLPANRVRSVVGLPDGTLAFAAVQSLFYYKRGTTAPKVRIKAVHTDLYSGAPQPVAELEAGRRISVEYEAVDIKTAPSKRQYRVRVAAADGPAPRQGDGWRGPTRENHFEWVPERAGRYTFEVQAIDRDLNYSPVAALAIDVGPPWYLDAWIATPLLAGLLGLVLVSGIASYRAVRARRDAAQLREAMLAQEQQARGQLEARNAELQRARQEADQANQQLAERNQELAAGNQELAAANDQLRREIDRRNAAEAARAQADARLDLLAGAETRRWDVDGIVGQSASLQQLLAEIAPLRALDATGVLILGESGTGKELVARALHQGSRRADRPFIALNCSAIPAELAESTFFGHVKGAFTGAAADKAGYFALADGGTLFLDEIGDLPLELQAKLLRVLEDGRLLPVGGAQERQVDVRVLAATHVDLPRRVAEGGFRQDLFYRLNRFVLEVPPLRQRREDLPLLTEHFRQLFAEEMGIEPPLFSEAALALMQGYDYPGNIRELKNLVEFALIKCGGAVVQPEHIHFVAVPPAAPVSAPISSPEERILAFVRERGSINNAECRELLDVERRQAAYLLKKLHQAQQLDLVGKNRGVRYLLATS